MFVLFNGLVKLPFIGFLTAGVEFLGGSCDRICAIWNRGSWRKNIL